MKLSKKIASVFSSSRLLLPTLAIAGIIGGLGIVSIMDSKGSADGSTCEGVCVNLTSEGMVPNELAVKVGTFVQFNAADGQKHNISLGEGAGGAEEAGHAAHAGKHEHAAGLSSGDFEADEAWRAQFNTPGTYRLHDHYNPKQNILVVVYEDSSENRLTN